MYTLAIVGKSGSNLQKILEDLNIGKIELFDFVEEQKKLMEPGEEGYRQVINYFGEEFLYKDGWLNLTKFWRFIHQDFHKLKIFDFLMEPLLFNQLQKREKSSNRKGGIILMPGLVELSLYEKFSQIFWLDLPKENLIANLSLEIAPMAAEKLWEAESRLFLKPEQPMIICKSQEELVEQVEKWLRFV